MHRENYHIGSYSDLIDAVAGVASDELDIAGLSFDKEFGCTIKFDGGDWDGKFDTVLAKLLVDVEKAVKTSFREYAQQNELDWLLAEVRQVRVKALVNPGCTEYKIFFDWIGNLLKDMQTDKSKLIALGIIGATVVGVLVGNTALNTYERVTSKAKDEETKQIMVQAIAETSRYEDKLIAPIRDLAGRLKKDDEVLFEESSSKFNKKLIKKTFGEPTSDIRTTVWVDGKYTVRRVDLKDDTATLEVEGRLLTASLKTLDDISRKSLSAMVGDGLDKKIAPDIDLQLSLHIEGEKNELYITGIDTPRETAVDLLVALGKARLTKMGPIQEQAKLPMSDDSQ